MMIDIWKYHELGKTVVIPTNGKCKLDGHAVMGKGLAKQATDRFPTLPLLLGEKLRVSGNHVYCFCTLRIITFPTKHDWRNDADISLIQQSAHELTRFIDRNAHSDAMPVYMPHVGCGAGNLTWEQVGPIIRNVLGTRIVQELATGILVIFNQVAPQNKELSEPKTDGVVKTSCE